MPYSFAADLEDSPRRTAAAAFSNTIRGVSPLRVFLARRWGMLRPEKWIVLFQSNIHVDGAS